MAANHTHEPADDDPTTHQGWIDHMVQTHGISPTHFRDMSEPEVYSVHFKEHAKQVAESAVNHPSHYGGRDDHYEAIKVIEAWELGFCLGNTVKYISRAGKKADNSEVQDLKKAAWYLNRRIEQLEQADG